MKNLSLLPLIFISLLTFGQAPQGINYQAVVRNSTGAVLANTTVGIKFQIHDGTPTGTVVFQETHSTQTNQFGLATLVIGSAGNLTSVNWGNGLSKYLQVEMDPAGGTNYTDMGTTQLVSVPYALYALTSGNGIGPTGTTGNNGTNGVTGATGSTGNNGTNGVTGATGSTGTNGVTGATGSTGNNGTNGVTGATGSTGNNGTNGVTGATGATGTNGTNGVTGATGSTGNNGTNGVTGATGSTGNNGTNGVTGATGSTGNNGTNGVTGAIGATGASGSNASLIAGPGIKISGDTLSLTTAIVADTAYLLSSTNRICIPSSQTWICPSSVYNIKVELWGGGGSGGGGSAVTFPVNATGASTGGNGGTGGYNMAILSVTPGQSYSIVIGGTGLHGVGGTCGTNPCTAYGGAGGSGGNSSFANLLTAQGGGGGGGTYATNYSSGGAGTNGTNGSVINYIYISPPSNPSYIPSSWAVVIPGCCAQAGQGGAVNPGPSGYAANGNYGQAGYCIISY